MRGEDHRIARLQRHVRMLLARDAGQGRARLPLAARADHQDLVAREIADIVLLDEFGQAGQVAVLLRRSDHPPQ
jgi:hypothetical protein